VGRAGGCTRRKSVCESRSTLGRLRRSRHGTGVTPSYTRRSDVDRVRVIAAGPAFTRERELSTSACPGAARLDSHSGMDMFDTMTSRSVRTTAAHHSTQR
jgi:hypothetical protein